MGKVESYVLMAGLASRQLACIVGGILLAGCAQFGIPDFPPELRSPLRAPGELFVVYHPQSVLGFGHTALIVAAPGGGEFVRYDQYASAEIAYERRVARGEAHFWEAVTSRLPSIGGYTREYVTRRRAPSAAALVGRAEYAVPVAVGAEARRRIYEAAEQRFAEAGELESSEARRYYLVQNNCQHFLLDLLHAGGIPEDHYFPKYLMEAVLEQYRTRDGGSPQR